MEHEQTIGPVQLSMLTFTGPELPANVRRVVDDLRNQRLNGVRLVDAVVLRKNTDGTLTRQPSPDPLPEIHSAGLVSRLLDRAQAEGTMASTSPSGIYETTGRGALFRGERMPDPRDAVPAGSYALALLIEHRWAAPLHDAILHSEATPAGNAWIGIRALQDLQLMSPQTAANTGTLTWR